MRRAMLIANPTAGRGALLPARRAEMLRICGEFGWTATMVETGPEPGSAMRLAAGAVQAGVHLVIACGGDGTVHGVLQGVAGTGTVLGVLPFGTANALARNLRLPLDPIAAMHRLMGYRAQRIPLGRAETEREDRWFAVLAGAGPDGMLVEEAAGQSRTGQTTAVAKARFGRSAYYARAAKLFLTRRFPAFQVEFQQVEQAGWERCEAIGVLASRVPDLGGLFAGLTAQSRLHHPYLEVHLLRRPAHRSLAAWIALSHLRLARWNPLGADGAGARDALHGPGQRHGTPGAGGRRGCRRPASAAAARSGFAFAAGAGVGAGRNGTAVVRLLGAREPRRRRLRIEGCAPGARLSGTQRGGTMTCLTCGCELNGDARFCNRCGARVGTAWAGVAAAPTMPGAVPAGGPYGQNWQPGMGGGAASVAAAYLIPKEEMQRRRVAGNLQPLGITWCLWGVYRLIAGVAASLAMHALALHGMWPGDSQNFLPGLFHLLVPIIALTTAVMAALALFTGYALLQTKPWARTLAIVLAILNLIKIPLGTTLGIYTLWVLAPRAAGVEYERLSAQTQIPVRG